MKNVRDSRLVKIKETLSESIAMILSSFVREISCERSLRESCLEDIDSNSSRIVVLVILTNFTSETRLRRWRRNSTAERKSKFCVLSISCDDNEFCCEYCLDIFVDFESIAIEKIRNEFIVLSFFVDDFVEKLLISFWKVFFLDDDTRDKSWEVRESSSVVWSEIDSSSRFVYELFLLISCWDVFFFEISFVNDVILSWWRKSL
jgi:hypothetical protein